MPISSLIRATEILIRDISGQSVTEKREVIQSCKWLQKVLRGTFGADSYVHGAAFSNTLLPFEPIEITQFLSNKDSTKWTLEANSSICQESVESMNRDSASERFVTENPIDKVELSVNDDTIECWLNVVKYRMTSNNISGALLTAILQVTNSIVGKDDLFLRSLTLIKSWVFFESKRYTFLDLSTLFRHDALVVMTMMIFATAGDFDSQSIENPLMTLIRFLEIFASMDWSNSMVSPIEIEPKESLREDVEFSGYLKNNDLLGLGLRPGEGAGGGSMSAQLRSNTRNPIKEELTRMLDHYRRFYSGNFVLTESDRQLASGIPDDTEESGGLTGSSTGPEGEYFFSNVSEQKRKPPRRGVVVMVKDPLVEGRNLCGSCPSVFNRRDVSDQLKAVFSKGLKELTDIINPLLGEESSDRMFDGPAFDEDSYRIIQKMFPICYSIICSKVSSERKMESPSTESSVTSAYTTVVRNLAHASSSSSSSSGHQRISDFDRMISFAADVSSKKVTDESIINLVIQALHQFGPMPIGEIGKQLQGMTSNADFPKLLKKRFGGLKKFISSHPHRFRFGDNHNFNPLVYEVGPPDEGVAEVGLGLGVGVVGQQLPPPSQAQPPHSVCLPPSAATYVGSSRHSPPSVPFSGSALTPRVAFPPPGAEHDAPRTVKSISTYPHPADRLSARNSPINDPFAVHSRTISPSTFFSSSSSSSSLRQQQLLQQQQQHFQPLQSIPWRAFPNPSLSHHSNLQPQRESVRHQPHQHQQYQQQYQQQQQQQQQFVGFPPPGIGIVPSSQPQQQLQHQQQQSSHSQQRSDPQNQKNQSSQFRF